MSEIKNHCEDCEALLGDACLEVHEFLDQYAPFFPIRVFYEYHRGFLHNSYGLSLIEGRWGELGKKAAMIHLVRDWIGAPIPRDLDWIEKQFPKAIMSLNSNPEQYDPMLDPGIVTAWFGQSLVYLAFKED